MFRLPALCCKTSINIYTGFFLFWAWSPRNSHRIKHNSKLSGHDYTFTLMEPAPRHFLPPQGKRKHQLPVVSRKLRSPSFLPGSQGSKWPRKILRQSGLGRGWSLGVRGCSECAPTQLDTAPTSMREVWNWTIVLFINSQRVLLGTDHGFV